MKWSFPSRTQLQQSVIWNLFLLTLGATFLAVGVQAITAKHGFVTSGVYGVSLLTWYVTDLFTPSVWLFTYNVPLFAVAWFFIGRQFFFYSLYSTIALTIISSMVDFTIPIQENFYAAIVAGVLAGTGGGIMLRTLGSGGGLDLIGVVLNRKWNISIGLFFFCFNSVLFFAASFTMSLDLVIASFIQTFISSNTLEYVLRLFGNRKMVYIVSKHGEAIGDAIITKGYPGATILHGHGAYSGATKDIILTVTNNVMLRRLEALVFEIDPSAMFIVENTFYVAGGKFPRKLTR